MTHKPTYEELEKRIEKLEQAKSDLNPTDEALQENGDYLQSIFRVAPIGIGVVVDRVLKQVNHRMCEMTGYFEEELTGQNARILYPSDKDYEYVGREKYEQIRAHGTGTVETRFKCKDGRIIDVLLSSTPLDLCDLSKGVTFTALDITEQKRAKANLQENEERYRSLFKNNHSVMLLIDPENADIIDANPAAISYYGWTHEEITRKKITDINIFTKEKVFQKMDQAKKGHQQHFFFRHRLSNEEIRDVEVYSGPITVFRKKLLYSIIHDITERKRAEEALRETELKFRMLADYTHDWEYWIDSDKNYVYISPSCERITGYSPEEFISNPKLILKIVKPEYAEKVHHHYFDENSRNTPNFPIEFPIIAKNGEEVWLEHNCTPIFNDQGEYVGQRGNNRDITDRKRAEKEKKQLEEQYHQAQKMESVGRLAGGVAHDFNNALSVITGFAEMALDDTDPAGKLYDDLNEILTAARHAADITRQLLAFARKQTIAPKVLDLNENVESMLKMIRRLIGEDIDLAWFPGATLWSVKVDPSQIDQILANLCVNARDAIEGVGKVTIESGNVTLAEDYCADHAGFVPGEYVQLSVSDNGCGMNKEILDNIFEPFFTTKDVDKGTGLGLATVYGIVKQNNGFINAYSEPGKGTTIKIYLPRHEDKAVRIQEKSTAQIPTGQGETILVVEDDPSILRIMEKILQGLDYTVLASSAPEKVMDIVREYTGKIHLLITDVIMPKMNGRDLAEQLQTICPDLKCIFMSGYTANAVAHQGVLDKGVNFIQKPFTKRELAETIRKVLANKN